MISAAVHAAVLADRDALAADHGATLLERDALAAHASTAYNTGAAAGAAQYHAMVATVFPSFLERVKKVTDAETAAAVAAEQDRIAASLADPVYRAELIDVATGMSASQAAFNAALAPLYAAQRALPAGAILMGTFALGESGTAAAIPADKAGEKQPAALAVKTASSTAWSQGIKFITPGAGAPVGRAVTAVDLPNVRAVVASLQAAFIGYVVNRNYPKAHVRRLTHTAETPLFIVRLGTTHTSCVEVYYAAELIAALTDSEGHLSSESSLAQVLYSANDIYLPVSREDAPAPKSAPSAPMEVASITKPMHSASKSGKKEEPRNTRPERDSPRAKSGRGGAGASTKLSAAEEQIARENGWI